MATGQRRLYHGVIAQTCSFVLEPIGSVRLPFGGKGQLLQHHQRSFATCQGRRLKAHGHSPRALSPPEITCKMIWFKHVQTKCKIIPFCFLYFLWVSQKKGTLGTWNIWNQWKQLVDNMKQPRWCQRSQAGKAARSVIGGFDEPKLASSIVLFERLSRDEARDGTGGMGWHG